VTTWEAMARAIGEATTGVRMRPPRHLVSPRAIWYWTARALCAWLAAVAVQVVWAALTLGDGLERWHVAALVATLVAAAVHLAVMPRWRFRVHRWEVTPHAVYTQAGWFDQERRIAPVSRIQTVDMQRGPFEQLFRLATVTVTTASAAGPLKIVGLDRDEAQRLVDDLAAAAEAMRGDAT
jgi:membrane protein YdbS with pleckstrin-like domain